MKKTIIATTIAALLASSAVPAFAQDLGVDAGADVTVEAPAVDAQVGVDANADATVDAGNADDGTDAGTVADNTFSSVTSSIAGSAAVDLSSVTDEANVTIVLLSSLEGDAATETAALDEAMSSNADAMTTLHGNVEANATIKAKLEAEGYTSDDVVAVTSSAEGAVTVYVDDRT